jgi:hypothetical protein
VRTPSHPPPPPRPTVSLAFFSSLSFLDNPPPPLLRSKRLPHPHSPVPLAEKWSATFDRIQRILRRASSETLPSNDDYVVSVTEREIRTGLLGPNGASRGFIFNREIVGVNFDDEGAFNFKDVTWGHEGPTGWDADAAQRLEDLRAKVLKAAAPGQLLSYQVEWDKGAHGVSAQSVDRRSGRPYLTKILNDFARVVVNEVARTVRDAAVEKNGALVEMRQHAIFCIDHARTFIGR